MFRGSCSGTVTCDSAREPGEREKEGRSRARHYQLQPRARWGPTGCCGQTHTAPPAAPPAAPRTAPCRGLAANGPTRNRPTLRPLGTVPAPGKQGQTRALLYKTGIFIARFLQRVSVTALSLHPNATKLARGAVPEAHRNRRRCSQCNVLNEYGT